MNGQKFTGKAIRENLICKNQPDDKSKIHLISAYYFYLISSYEADPDYIKDALEVELSINGEKVENESKMSLAYKISNLQSYETFEIDVRYSIFEESNIYGDITFDNLYMALKTAFTNDLIENFEYRYMSTEGETAQWDFFKFDESGAKNMLDHLKSGTKTINNIDFLYNYSFVLTFDCDEDEDFFKSAEQVIEKYVPVEQKGLCNYDIDEDVFGINDIQWSCENGISEIENFISEMNSAIGMKPWLYDVAYVEGIWANTDDFSVSKIFMTETCKLYLKSIKY